MGFDERNKKEHINPSILIITHRYPFLPIDTHNPLKGKRVICF